MKIKKKSSVCSFVVFTLLVSMLIKIQPLQASSRIQTMIDEMSIEQKITQMIMPDFRKWKAAGQSAETNMTVLNPEVAEIIDTYDFGGVILFAENVQETKQTAKLTTDLQEAAIKNVAGNGKIPLFITVDQEGGIVYRLGSGTALPGNMALGATKNPESARKVGQIIGRELSALGINVNFAPALDVNNNPNNPVIGLRSISSDPKIVSQLGVPMIHGMQEYNIATAAKHFPGHGDTATDSHTGLPAVNKSYEELAALELIPFQAAVDNGVDMLMTAHIQYPQIEKDTVISKSTGEEINIPATLSDDIITGIVRNKMKYDGIVITDAMNMDAISKNFGESEAVIMAIDAGVDICLMPTILRSKADLAKLDTIIADVMSAIDSNRISEDTLNNAVRRILELKEKRGILDYESTYPGWESKLAKANVEVGSVLNRQLEREISGEAVTIVKNEENMLPLNPKSGEKVLLIGAYANELPGMEFSIRRLIDEGKLPEDIQIESFNYTSSMTNETLQEKINGSDYVVVISEIGSAGQLAQTHWLTAKPTFIVDYANSQGIPTALMSISKPYDTANYPNAKGVLAVYGNKGMDPTEGLKPDFAFGPNIPAGIEAIFGGIDICGTLPVNIPVIENGAMNLNKVQYALGYGITYKDVVSNIAVQLPQQDVEVEKEFVARVALNDLQTISKEDYKVLVTMNQEDFTIKQSDAYVVEGNQVTFAVEKGDTPPVLEIIVTGNVEKQNVPVINTIQVVDAKDRIFSMGDNAYINSVINIIKKDVPAPEINKPETNKPEVAPEKEKQSVPSTSVSTSDTTSFQGICITLLITGVYLAFRKLKKEN